ncbi:hypothetical protein GF377_03890 [candidate division GN15 bacterium]|nr:hypothetical protein [candidate division GN15 bacterium]
MPNKNGLKFASFEDLEDKWNRAQFDCDDIADIDDPIVLDWCSRLDDWAPKVALCFNRNTSAVTLDRISQHEMAELRRLVCYHQNCSIETLERLLTDFDKITVESADEQLAKIDGYKPKRRRPVAMAASAPRKTTRTRAAKSPRRKSSGRKTRSRRTRARR